MNDKFNFVAENQCKKTLEECASIVKEGSNHSSSIIFAEYNYVNFFHHAK